MSVGTGQNINTKKNLLFLAKGPGKEQPSKTENF